MTSYARKVLTQADIVWARRAWRVGFVCGWCMAVVVMVGMGWLYWRYGIL